MIFNHSLIKLNLEIRDKPRGMVIFISGGYNQSDVARELISIAKKWHIFIVKVVISVLNGHQIQIKAQRFEI